MVARIGLSLGGLMVCSRSVVALARSDKSREHPDYSIGVVGRDGDAGLTGPLAPLGSGSNATGDGHQADHRPFHTSTLMLILHRV
jgi:hypothetical protein